MGISEMACNPTCVPPIFHSILQSRDPSCLIFFLISFIDKEEDMKVSICFGETRGKLMFGYSSLDIFVIIMIGYYYRLDKLLLLINEQKKLVTLLISKTFLSIIGVSLD